MLYRFLALVLFVCFLSPANPSNANALALQHAAREEGIEVSAIPLNPGAKFGMKITPGKVAVGKTLKALRLLRQKSPINADILQRIRAQVKVVIIYDPNYPPSKQGKIITGVIVPRALKEGLPSGGPRTLLFILSRYGGAHTPEEIALTISQRVIGYGLQELGNRIRVNYRGEVLNGDMVCESMLYYWNAARNLKMNMRDHSLQDSFRQGKGLCTWYADWLRLTYKKDYFDGLPTGKINTHFLIHTFYKYLAQKKKTEG
ncbi:MAG: hypothetical protein OQJ97_07585 [Rhodospirillales bacterium]|nr:hypothetical protein [Rhodospirillales bacterium]